MRRLFIAPIVEDDGKTWRTMTPAEKRARVLALVEDGLSLTEIGRVIEGCTPNRAHMFARREGIESKAMTRRGAARTVPSRRKPRATPKLGAGGRGATDTGDEDGD